DLASSNEISTQKISVSNHISGFQYTADKPDSFVIDMDSFSHGGLNKEINQNPRITKSLSRKGSMRGDKKIITSNCTISNDKDSIVATSPKVSIVLTIFFDLASSDRIATSLVGSNTVEKPTTVSVGSTDQTNNPQVHHQITITTGNIKAPPDSRFSLLRRNNSRRSSSLWVLDPKRILFLFAT
ncbi:hypothetical protein Gorai_008504, partial [Gossypium raimondii]|nr:hypothetical protein [Gossypium raimondii]